MKKTILATVIAATSFGAMATDTIDPIGRNHEVGENLNGSLDSLVTEHGTNATVDRSVTGEITIAGDNGSIVIDTTSGAVSTSDNQATILGKGRISHKAKQKANDYLLANNGEVGIPPMNPIEDTRPIHGNETKVEVFNKVMDNHDFDAEITKGDSVDGSGSYVLTMNDKTTGEKVVIDLGENADEAVARAAEVRATIKAKVQDHNPGVEPIDPGFGSDPLPGVPQGERAQAAYEVAQQNAASQQNQIDELYAIGNQNASDIDTLFGEVDRLDTRIDQTQALNAATVNARPMVTNGMTAFGAGVGYAGSEAALAIGVAHSFEDTGWSASGTVAASSDDSVLGAGVQYAF